MQLTAQNLLWVKNVKKSGGTEWAYMDDEHKDEFQLHFSKHWRTGADLPKVNDVILLFQTVEMPDYYNTFLTHLVTPVYENGEDTNDQALPRARQVRVIARASSPSPIAMPRDLIFYLPNRGHCNELLLIRRDNGTGRRYGEEIPLPTLQIKLWDLFDGHFHSTTNQ